MNVIAMIDMILWMDVPPPHIIILDGIRQGDAAGMIAFFALLGAAITLGVILRRRGYGWKWVVGLPTAIFFVGNFVIFLFASR